MDSKFSTVNAAKRTPLIHGNLPVQLMMWDDVPTRKRLSRTRLPIHPRIVGLGATLLIGAFATDVAYAQSELFQWENFSIWLITAGLERLHWFSMLSATALPQSTGHVSAVLPAQPFCPS